MRGHLILLCVCAALTWLGSPEGRGAASLEQDFAPFERWRTGRPELRVAPFAEWFGRPSAPLTLHTGCAESVAQRADFVRHIRHAPTPAPQLVELRPLYGRVRFDKTSEDAPFIVACALAERLPAIAAVFERHGVTEVVVNSAYRKDPDVSYHAMGLALDIQRLHFADGRVLPILGNFPVQAGRETCGALPPLAQDSARRRDQVALLSIACDLARDVDAGLSTLLTPNYPGHADHFHVDVRPGERRVYLR
ncbi:MAG: hypothetical protein IPG17_19380 [Sandaracinaceae bacterium]|nr:hypothetical protein [Sandaracinaceae bacterium]MBP7680687.1 hypothetical protein [Deltaproteobacteria bacterium]MBK6812427.1 hypothetical protein [Sandaracinaceae bacterium]MBK7150706.1 hypothetical protein [Sandaracinaceae bacterium]MBK7777603.1 hypothetical protein [Sandaracinaceae bacterium]